MNYMNLDSANILCYFKHKDKTNIYTILNSNEEILITKNNKHIFSYNKSLYIVAYYNYYRKYYNKYIQIIAIDNDKIYHDLKRKYKQLYISSNHNIYYYYVIINRIFYKYFIGYGDSIKYYNCYKCYKCYKFNVSKISLHWANNFLLENKYMLVFYSKLFSIFH